MLHGIHRIWVYENIGKWGGRESYVCGIHKEITDLSDKLVGASWIRLVFACVHRCIVCLIVNK